MNVGRATGCAALAAGLALAGLLGCAKPAPAGGGEVPPEPEAGLPALPVLEGAAHPPSRVVLVSVAGLVPALYLGAPETAPMPMLATLARAGVAADAMLPVAPAASYPANGTLATGRTPAGHGLTTDRLPGDHGSVSRHPTPRSPLRAPALWDAVAEAGRRSVVLGWPGSSGGRIDLVFPETFPLAPGEDWKAWVDGHTSPGLLEAAGRLGAASPACAAAGPERDHLLIGLACETLRSKAPPALLLVSLSQAEPAIVQDGPSSPAAAAAFAATDRELARLVGCLREVGFLDSTALVVAGDHGAVGVHAAVSPNAALLEKGLIVPDVDPHRMQRWSALTRSNGSSAFVYARTETDARLARRALEAAAERTHAFRIVSAREMIERGADPEAWFGLEASEGVWFDDDPRHPLVAPAPIRGSWGTISAASAPAPGFVAWGRGVQSGQRIPTMKQTDVAPTVAVLLGFGLGELDGRPLAAALALPDLPAVGARSEKEPVHGH